MTTESLRVGTVPIYIEGSGEETIVMIHGWPDTFRLWDKQVAALSSTYRCVRFTLPGFDRDSERKAYTINEICEFLNRLIYAVSPDRPVTLLLHDWGCFFGYQFYARHPRGISRIVGVDIGDVISARAEMTPKAKAMILAYQNWLALAWTIGGRLGNRMTRFMARALRCPTYGAHVGAQMNYPYYMQWWAGTASYQREARPFEPTCPMLFVYGKRKPFMFHADSWLRRLTQESKNAVVAFDTGHWVMIEQPENFNKAVLQWLQKAAQPSH